MTAIDNYLTASATRFEDELCELLRIPSVSADSRHNPDTARASQWIAQQFQSLGFQTTVHPTVVTRLSWRIRPSNPVFRPSWFMVITMFSRRTH